MKCAIASSASAMRGRLEPASKGRTMAKTIMIRNPKSAKTRRMVRVRFTESKVQVRLTVPFMLNIPHYQGAIERYAAFRKFFLVRKITRKHFLHLQRLHLPGFSFQPQAVETILLARYRIAHRLDIWHSDFFRHYGLGIRHFSRGPSQMVCAAHCSGAQRHIPVLPNRLVADASNQFSHLSSGTLVGDVELAGRTRAGQGPFAGAGRQRDNAPPLSVVDSFLPRS